ncbi:MAG: lytic murein transglycosylase [Elusimicrobiota bacterium]|nr:MAG: lytic murein transglycosylase [Elusimicrobiota bacterium]
MAVPSAGGWASFPGEPARERRAAKDGDSAPGASSPSPGASAPSPKAESDAKPALGGAAGGLVSAAKTLKAAAAGQRDRLGLEKGLLAQVALDQKVDDRLRPALAALRASGQDTPANVSRAARAALAASGQDAAAEDEEEVSAAVARASAPPAPPAKPEALQEAARAIAEAPPLSLQEREEVRRLAMNPPPPTSPTVPTGPPPKSAMDAYAKHEGVFDKAEKDFGVKPEHILGILGVETRWGGNTGKFPSSARCATSPRASGPTAGPRGPPSRPARTSSR